jgi:Zn-dependent protease with chaperone function
MNALIETLNRLGEAAIPLTGQMLWQTSLLIIVLLALDLLLRHRIRAGFRYALWMLLLVKLVLPPSLALPTGAGYWIERPVKVEAPVEPPVAEVAALPPPAAEFNHTADPGIIVEADFFDHLLAEAMADAPPAATVFEVPTAPAPTTIAPAVQMTWHGQLLAAWLAGTLLLLGWMLWRWRWVTRLVRASEPAPADLQALLANVYQDNVCRASCPTPSVLPASCRHSGGVEPCEPADTLRDRQHACTTLRLTDAAMSPAVCGLFRPVILLPRKLVGKLSREQLGTVLLHELIHLHRRDLWVNCVQTLLQIAAWWHPLLWLANARIRRVREEAVDEAVACALRDDADAYPATLLEVAKLTFTRPLMTLGLVGILESKHALKQRIRRLLELPPLESTRLKWWQWVAVAAIALTALPMAEGQRSAGIGEDTTQWTVDAAFIQVSGTDAAFMLPRSRPDIETESVRAWIVQANGFQRIWSHAKNAQIGRGNRVVLLPAEMKVVPEGRRTVLGVTHQVVGMRANHDSAPPGYFVREGDERILQLAEQVPEPDLFSRLALSLKRGEHGGLRAEVSALSRSKHDLRGLPEPGNELREWTNFQFSAVLDLPADAVALALQPKQNIHNRTGGDIVLISLNRGSANFTEPVKQLRITAAGQLLWEGTPLDTGDLVQRLIDEAGRQNWLRVEVNAAKAPHAVVTDVMRRLSWAQFWNVCLNPAVWEQAHGSVRFSVRPLAAAEVAPRLAELLSDEILQKAVDALAEPDRALFPTVETIRSLVGAKHRHGDYPLEVAVQHADAKAAARAALEIAWAYRQSRLNVELAAEDAVRIDDDPDNPRRAGLRIRDITVTDPGNYRVGGQKMSLEAISTAIREEAARNPRFELVEVRTLDAQGEVITPPKDLREALRRAGVRNIARYWGAEDPSSEARANDQGSLSPQPAPTSSETPDRRVTTKDINALGFDWLRSPPLSLGHTNLTEYGAQMITPETLFPDPRVSGYRMIGLEPRFVLVPVEGLTRALGGQLPLARPLIIASNELAALTNSLIEAGAVDHSSAAPTRFSKMSGGVFHWQVAKEEPSQVLFQTADNPATNAAASPRQIVFGARHSVPAFAPDWVPLTLLARPFAADDDSLHSILSLATGGQQRVVLAQAEETIPPGGSLVWASTNEVRDGFAQAVILHNSGPPAEEADESADGAGEAAALIWIARELIATGNLDEAERLLREAAVNATTTAEIDHHLDRIRRLKLVGTASPDFVKRPAQTSPRSSPERRKLLEKLNRIILDRVGFDNVPLVEVVKELQDESRRRDPQKEGIRFMIASSIDVTDYEDDPADSTGRPPPTRPTTRLEIGEPRITINPPMSDVRMIDVLNAVVRSAGEHVEFVVGQSAVVFRPKLPEQPALQTRVFRLNPNTFDRMKAAHTNAPAHSGAVTNEVSVVIRVVRDYFEAAGVSLVAPKMLFFNERTGMLMIKATLEDLEIIQGALEKLVGEGEPQASPPAESGTGAGAGDGRPGEAAAKVMNAKQLMDAGKLDEAEALLREVALNAPPSAPTSAEAFYRLDRIQQLRFANTQRPESLKTRFFRVNPNTVYQAMEGVFSSSLGASAPRGEPASAPLEPESSTAGGGARSPAVTNDMTVVNPVVRGYFEMAGVKFEPPKLIHFNDRTGMLMIKATPADLEIVQRAVEMLNYEPTQVTLEVRTVEVTKDDVRALGFDWFMNPWPGQPVTHTNPVTGILTDPQFRLVMKALEQRANVNVELFPRTTTSSGRQTQLRRSENTNVVSVVTNTNGVPEYRTESVAVGTTVTLSPFVFEDGHTIDLLADVRLVQFLGYDDPVARGLPAQVPLPHFNRQSTRQSMKIRSGDTMVLGGMTTQQLVVAKDKVPVLGDIPLLGRLFRHEEKFMETKHVLVFITPSIIDPAGNRVEVPRQPGQE